MALPQHVEERRLPLVLVKTQGLSREDWLAWRRRGIGSSDCSAILGLNAYSSPIMVYFDKLGTLPEKEETMAMKLGNILEEVAAEEFATATGWRVQRRNAILQHPDRPYMLANLDREFFHPVYGRCPLEIKTTGEWAKGDWQDGKAPFNAQVQLQHQLAVTGTPFGCLAVLIGNREFKFLEMPRDDELINSYIIPAEELFWKRVQERNPPEWSGIEAEGDLMKDMYPKSEPDKAAVLPGEAENWAIEYKRAHADAKAAEARKEAAAANLKAALQDAEIGYVGGQVVVTYKTVNAERFDQTGFQAAHPALFSEWKKPAPYRAIRVK